MAELTTVETAEQFVGKKIKYYKRGWLKTRPEADALHTRGNNYLVVRNNAEVEVGLQIRADDPWIVEEVES